ncbi:nucleotidyltransferase family protein [Thalassotalea sp. M1531]|uniref:Nucleotidyltransferase family protein n=1 Tax=Thalassotalea algicola TaxID=2716224 RepID=A0A7Y0LAC5_9GAMM|nr:nucleotidyltransferase family protein [Thalassotalea algicola]NMP30548.1 nucleotidyltransferase family protein [Thalassotalea algicola]
MSFDGIAIVELLRKPKVVNTWQDSDWEALIEQAYHTGLLARIYFILKDTGLLNNIPCYLSWHFTSAWKLFLAHNQDVQSEVERINGVLNSTGIKPTYLKGTAYLLEGLTCSKGRIFADVDVFVHGSELSQAENILKWQGWTVKELDAHDQHYYRNWMHELPPMVNSKTGLTLDLHHNLLPIVSRVKLDSELLLANLNEGENSNTLSAEDKILHSAIHLLLDGEFNHGFRDLHDIYLLIVENQLQHEEFISQLIARAIELNFEFILYHCLRLQQDIFLLKVDDDILNMLIKNKFSKMKANFIVSLFKAVLSPLPLKGRYNSISLFTLFIRSHWLKMPLHILVPHLVYKGFIAPLKKKEE